MKLKRKNLVGQIVNGWLLLEELPFDPPDEWSHQRKYANRRFVARNVESGYVMESTLTNIRNKRSKTGSRRIEVDLTGRTIGVYKVLGKDEQAGRNMWKVFDSRIDKELTISKTKLQAHHNYILRTGRIRHLGRSADADLNSKQLYSTWQFIKQATMNTSHRGYKHYGAKGIRMCHGWKQRFDAFRYDIMHEVGEKPTKNHVLWPINDALVMAPGNVQWLERSKSDMPFSTETDTIPERVIYH